MAMQLLPAGPRSNPVRIGYVRKQRKIRGLAVALALDNSLVFPNERFGWEGTECSDTIRSVLLLLQLRVPFSASNPVSLLPCALHTRSTLG